LKNYKRLNVGPFSQITSFRNLLLAFRKARSGKPKKPNIARFEAKIEQELFQLQRELHTGIYQPGEYRAFRIFEPKVRLISAAPFRDRVVHHAVCNIVEPIFEPAFITDTFANRRNKGTHRGIYRCKVFLRKNRFVLKTDIRKYFPSIDLDILKNLIARKIHCPQTLGLINKIIDNSNQQEFVPDYFPGDNLFTLLERRRGLPMGNLTSQFFANIYLSPLDHYVKEVLRLGYVRYVDDFVIFADDKKTLTQARQRIEKFLAENLRLRLHPDKTHISPCEKGITFLGQRVFRTHQKLKNENVRRFRKRLRQRLRDFRAGRLHPDKLEQQLNAWLGHAKQADTFRLRKAILRQLFFEENINVVETPNGVWKVLERPRKPAPHDNKH
jgi:retron-type reverse transcriptase